MKLQMIYGRWTKSNTICDMNVLLHLKFVQRYETVFVQGLDAV